MPREEKMYVHKNRKKFGELFKHIKTLTIEIDRENSFSHFIFIEKGFKWEDQVSRWGSSFFSSALPNRIMPDYFLYNGDLAVKNDRIKDMWNNLISDLTEAIHKDNFMSAADVLDPKLCLFALKSSRLTNARLARYFINQDMLKEMAKRLSLDENHPDLAKLFSSPYWQLAESVHSHLFGRRNFFSERGRKPRASKMRMLNAWHLPIVITANKDRSLGYLNFTQKILYVDEEIALKLGSEQHEKPNLDIDPELVKIKKEIAYACYSSVAKLITKEYEEPESVHHSIVDVAVNIAAEVRNKFDFDRKRDSRIGEVLDKLFTHSTNANTIMSNLLELFGLMKLDSLKTTTEKLKFLLTSLFDLFMILPESKSFLFNYASGDENANMDITWAIVGKGPIDEKSFEVFLRKNPFNLGKIYNDLFSRTDLVYARDEASYDKERDVRKKCPRLVNAINATLKEKKKLHKDLVLLKRKEFKLKTVVGNPKAEIKDKGLYALCLALEACSYLTGEAHENTPLSFTFLISGSHAWHAFSDVISDSELFEPESTDNKGKEWEPDITAKMIKTNYSILQVPRVVAFFDRSQAWDDRGLRWGQIARVAESENNKGLIGYPFFYNSQWKVTEDWGGYDFIVQVKGTMITVLQGYTENWGVIPFLEWDTRKNELSDIKEKERMINNYIDSFMNNDEKVLKRLVMDVLMTISATPGEGTLIVFNSNNSKYSDELKKCFHPMDSTKWEQRWRKKEYLLRYDRDTLRAALRMDGGARMIKNKNSRGNFDIQVFFRLSITPNPDTPIEDFHLEFLIGRGSRHHSAAALSLQFIDDYQSKDALLDKGAVIVVSADGPITLLPYPDWYKNRIVGQEEVL